MKPLYEYPQASMTEHQQKMIIMLSRPDVVQRMAADIHTVAPRLWNVLNGACKMHNINVSDEVKLFIILGMMPPSPGAVMLYVHALFHIKKRRGIKHPISMLDFCTLFDRGFPSEITLEQAWDDQKKDAGGNEVDDISSYE